MEREVLQSIGNSPIGRVIRKIGDIVLGNYTEFNTTGHLFSGNTGLHCLLYGQLDTYSGMVHHRACRWLRGRERISETSEA